MVLVSQPTHPYLWKDDDRMHICGVCKTPFTCPPPTRLELMRSFTGPELGALVSEGSVIGAHERFSRNLMRDISESPTIAAVSSNLAHWINGAYLITEVVEDDGVHEFEIETPAVLSLIRTDLERSESKLELSNFTHSESLHLMLGKGAMRNVTNSRDVSRALTTLTLPAKLYFSETPPGETYVKNVGKDHVVAVNLTRLLDGPVDSNRVSRALSSLYKMRPETMLVEISHYVGGPCDDGDIRCCIVLGGRSGRGWTMFKDLVRAVRTASDWIVRSRSTSMSRKGTHPHKETRDEAVVPGCTVLVRGLLRRTDLNDQKGIVLRLCKTGRWLVRLEDGTGVKIKGENLKSIAGRHGRVYVFWGDARWSRTQLLGEIARGHWGLATACVGDLIADVGTRRCALEDRLAFAPETEMTETSMRGAEAEMAMLRARAREASEA